MFDLINTINTMKTSRVSNYVIAGLDSYLLENGKVRLFENSRNHQDQLTPHSHRFDFTCLVLRGSVCNILWEESAAKKADLFEVSQITYAGKIGEHAKTKLNRGMFCCKKQTYVTGDTYSMNSDQIHSIEFSKGALVLFFEGPPKSDSSVIIEPVVDGRVIPTYESKDYMFLTEAEQPEKE